MNKIIILGGGSAGWMTAATMIKTFPDKEIVLIESPNAPIVGVGESTVGGIRDWTKYLEIDDKIKYIEYGKDFDYIMFIFGTLKCKKNL